MKSFSQYQPTKIFFGSRCVNKIAKFFRGCGNSSLLVTYHPSKLAKAQKQVCEKFISLLEEAGIRVEYYYGALPNPTTDCVDDGVHAAKQKKVDCILALGGGSVIDTGKNDCFPSDKPGLAMGEIVFGFFEPIS